MPDTATITFEFNDQKFSGLAGETIGAALLRSGVQKLRSSPNAGGARGGFCWMGICQECLVEVHGKNVEACRTEICDGLVVRSVRYV